jgi:DNA ligase (NAD+)
MDYQKRKEELLKHNALYYDEAKPIIPDYEYDRLYDQLVLLEKQQGFKDFDSPTQRVGHARGKVKHPYKLYSLEKTYNHKEVPKEFSIKTRKLDGACVAHIYNNGKYIRTLSRGDGEYGEDLTPLFKWQFGSGIIPYKGVVSIVGECVTFEKPDNYRNYVAGAINLKDVEEFKKRQIAFIAHDVLGVKEDYVTRVGNLECYNVIRHNKVVEAIPSDGEVYRIDSYKECQKLGYTSKYPKFAIALKTRENETAQTILKDVIWAVGRTGTVNPTGIVEPVIIGGATVSRLTLHNIAFIEDNDICLGDKIELERAGEIIPKYLRTVDKSPVRVKITAKEAEESIEAVVKRVGPKLFVADGSTNSEKILLNYISHMDIQGLGPASISKLGLTQISDLYKPQPWDSLGVNGKKIAQEIEYSKTKSYEKVLAALGIPNVGNTLAKKIVAVLPKFSDLAQIEFETIPKVGPIITEKILIWFDENVDWVLELPVQLEMKPIEFVEEVEKRIICITGKLDMTKKELASILEEKGYEVKDSVTKKTYALISDGRETSTKTTNATKHGIKIVNYFDQKTNILAGII